MSKTSAKAVAANDNAATTSETAKSSPIGETFDNDEKKTQLNNCEAIIRQNESGPFITGRNLNVINKQVLYKVAGFSSFEDYCRQRWAMSDKHAYRLIKAAECYDILAKHQSEKNWVMPRHEAQLRPLVALHEKEWEPTWKKMLKKFGTKPFTAEEVDEFINDTEEKTKTTAKNNKTNDTNTGNEASDDVTEIPAKTLKKKLDKIEEIVSKALEKTDDKDEIPIKKYRDLLEKIKKLIEANE